MALPWRHRGALHVSTQDDPATRWHQARTVYEQYRRDPEVRATWWKVVALLSIVAGSLQGVALIRSVHRPTVEPYYVYVTPSGQVLGTEQIGAKPYSVDEEVLRHLTVEWIEWVRSIPLDPVILKKNWGKALALCTDVTAERLRLYAKAIDLTTLSEKAAKKELAVGITIVNVLTLSERVFRVTWREALSDGTGAEKEAVEYTGEFQYVVRKPQTQKELDQNALGIWLARFTWDKHRV
jgi:type IV secretion system protein VirB5